jgi:hypothetical protein
MNTSQQKRGKKSPRQQLADTVVASLVQSANGNLMNDRVSLPSTLLLLYTRCARVSTAAAARAGNNQYQIFFSSSFFFNNSSSASSFFVIVGLRCIGQKGGGGGD